MKFSLTSSELQQCIMAGKIRLENKTLVIVLNQVNRTPKRDSYHADTDFFSEAEVLEISDALSSQNITFKVIADEHKFMDLVYSQQINEKNAIVWNLTRQGSEGNKKSLITSLADFYKIPYVGSSVEAMNLSRDKEKFEMLIKENNLGGLATYSSKAPSIDFSGDKLFIVKNSAGSASIGLTNKSIQRLSAEAVQEKVTNHSEITIEPFVAGFEIEVPVIKIGGNFKALPPVGLEINGHRYLRDSVLTESLSNDYNYSFYELKEELKGRPIVDSDLSVAQIINKSVKIAGLLGLSNYGRIDFRVSNNGTAYCFDVASTPYLIQHSSVIFDASRFGISQGQMILAIIGSDD